MKKLLLASLAATLLTACTVNTTRPPMDSFYQLGVASPHPVASPRFERVVIHPLRSDSLRQERAMLYSEDPDGLALHRYNYHFWSDSPPKMVALVLREYLDQARIARQVLMSESGVRGELDLTGRLLHFEHLITGGVPIRVRVALRLQLTRRSDNRLLLANTYRHEVDTSTGTMLAINAAFSQAVSDAMAAFLSDLESLEMPPP